MMERAEAIDIDAEPRYRLVNSLAKRRAEWLTGRIDGPVVMFKVRRQGSESFFALRLADA